MRYAFLPIILTILKLGSFNAGAANDGLGLFDLIGVRAPGEVFEHASSSTMEAQLEMEAQSLSGQVRNILQGDPSNSSLDDRDVAQLEVNQANRILGEDEKLLEKAMVLYNAKDFNAAIRAFIQVLNYETVTTESEKQALLFLARIYYQTGMPVKSISLLELFVERFRGDPRREEIIFQIGKINQEVGHFEAAIASFYRVLNAIILADEELLDRFLKLARMAQFEIARTHFDLEQWPQALELLERISLFELGENDRETLRFYHARALLYVGRRSEGLQAIERFAEDYPASPFLAELRYEKARMQIEMNKISAGRDTMLDLVEMGGDPRANQTSEWIEWRRASGNFLANYFYQEGQYEVALRLYQAIVVMDDSPRWQLPIIAQMASCFRHLKQQDRAIESLDFIVQEVRALRERAEVEKLSEDLEFFEESAAWQIQLLRWQNEFAIRMASQSSQ